MATKIYKYMRFDDKNYYLVPALQNKIFFGSRNTLRGSDGDHEELTYSWETNSFIFRDTNNDLSGAYETLFASAAIFCSSKTLNESCFKKFTLPDGICYEFEYVEEDNTDRSSCGSIKYVKYINRNAPNFIIGKVGDRVLAAFLKNPSPIPHIPFLCRVWPWLDGSESRNLSIDHIVREILLKKKFEYRDEEEFRFVNLGDAELLSKNGGVLIDCNSVGLKLSKIFTTDMGRAKKEFTCNDVEICEFPFKRAVSE